MADADTARKKENVISPGPPVVAIYFQKYPGVVPRSGIADVPYKIGINDEDKTPANAKTDAEGKISFSLPEGAKGKLEIFGTIYELEYVAKLANYNSIKGAQQRLKMLGYHVGSVDGKNGPLTERATLLFQADSDHAEHSPHCPGSKNGTLMIDGILGDETKKGLMNLVKSKGGE